MKKLLLLTVVLLANVANTYAEDILEVLPFTTTAGAGIDEGELDYTETTTINFCSSNEYIGFQFDIHVPAGVLIDFESDECSRVAFTKKGSKYTYLHQPSMSTVKTSTHAGYDRYTVSVVDATSNKPFIGNSGEDVLTMYFGVPSTLAAGVYPIYFSRVYMTKADNTMVPDASTDGYTATSYMVVGDGTGALAIEGTLPSFVNDELESSTAVTGLDLANATAIASLTLKDGVELTKPTADVTVGELTYNRTVTYGAYASIILPVAVSDGTFFVWDGNGKDAQGNVTFTEQTGLAANTPAIVTADVAVTLANVALEGDVSKQTITEGYYLKANTMKKVKEGGNAIINPYRASWILPAGVKGFNLNTADGIKSVSLDEVEGADIYDLNGRKLNKAAKGVNIIGGQKVLRK